MHEGQVITEKEILADGFIFYEDFGTLKVFTKPYTIMYWDTLTSRVNKIGTYTPRSK